MNFVRFSISYFCGMNGSIKQYEWFKRLNDRQVNELIGLIDDWLIIDTEPIDSNVWLDRERWTNIDFVMIFVRIAPVCLYRDQKPIYVFLAQTIPHQHHQHLYKWSIFSPLIVLVLKRLIKLFKQLRFETPYVVSVFDIGWSNPTSSSQYIAYFHSFYSVWDLIIHHSTQTTPCRYPIQILKSFLHPNMIKHLCWLKFHFWHFFLFP